MMKKPKVNRYDGSSEKGESVDEFLERFESSGQCDDVDVGKNQNTGQRYVTVGTATFVTDRAVKAGLPDLNVLLWAASKAFYAAANILLAFDEYEDAQWAESKGRKYWKRMREYKQSHR